MLNFFKVMKMTEEEMRAMHIPPKARDYCAHLLRDVKICHRRTAPFHILCTKERHAYIHCLEEE